MRYLSYWRDTLEELLPNYDINLPKDKLEELAMDIAESHSMYSEASGDIYIPNPCKVELDETKRRLEKNIRELEEKNRLQCEEADQRIRSVRWKLETKIEKLEDELYAERHKR